MQRGQALDAVREVHAILRMEIRTASSFGLLDPFVALVEQSIDEASESSIGIAAYPFRRVL